MDLRSKASKVESEPVGFLRASSCLLQHLLSYSFSEWCGLALELLEYDL